MPKVREPLDPKISMGHFLAYYLRFVREQEGLSLTQWGKIIGLARSSVSNIEAGRARLQEDYARRLDVKFETGGLFELLLWYSRMAHDPNWFKQYSEHERHAAEIKVFHGQVIPLLLQTDDYTRAYGRLSTAKDREAVLAGRIARKRAVLEREDPPYIWALLDEAVLARRVGGPEVMRPQLEHLLEMADRWNVILRVVPFSAGEHLGSDGFFQLIGLPDRNIAYAGAKGGGRLIEMQDEVKEFADTFERIGAKADSQDASRELIKQYLESYP
ncbi:helix-turn-helix domain-containing protein [Actinomadura opuntiae]|uniref:helix-turn-helix domain-containing protein n=1 Tax=Actinomadura sp. OS1-43 TaxID=604315 RepID=UPI00255AD69C|nr:helix-turn-helix transcriptional regulator [Actinomadura sp. OS1-43]MDL4813716.1 helix-turn-helix transcriptional regulator [Actinomadura sp. OS1-43]